MSNIKFLLTTGRIIDIFEENKSWWKNLLIDKPRLSGTFLNQFPIMKLKDHFYEFSPDIRDKINVRWKAEMNSLPTTINRGSSTGEGDSTGPATGCRSSTQPKTDQAVILVTLEPG